MGFNSGEIWTAERLVGSQTALGAPVYLYVFDPGYPAADSAGLHAFHASELPYVFGIADRITPAWPHPPSMPEEAALSAATMRCWTSFVRAGTPAAAGEPALPAFGSSHAYMAFGDRPKAGT